MVKKEKQRKTLWLLSSLGIGAGVMYLLDPEQGAGRYNCVRGSVDVYGRQTGAKARGGIPAGWA